MSGENGNLCHTTVPLHFNSIEPGNVGITDFFIFSTFPLKDIAVNNDTAGKVAKLIQTK